LDESNGFFKKKQRFNIFYNTYFFYSLPEEVGGCGRSLSSCVVAICQGTAIYHNQLQEKMSFHPEYGLAA
jgi:hypothetical protein